MTEKNLYESDAVTRTKTALVFDLADGRTVELTAHVRTSRDSGLRAIEERDPENEEGTESQRCFEAATADLVLRDVVAEDDDPIGLLPVFDLDVDVDVPDDWERLDPETVAGKVGDPYVMNPVFEHDSGEAWLVVTKKLETYAETSVDGQKSGGTYPVFDVYIEAGTPSLGIHSVRDIQFSEDVDELENVVEAFLDEYDHGGDS